MTGSPMQQKFPEASTHRDYDIFEVSSDGSAVWRTCVFGMENVELRLRELALDSDNKFFAINLQDRSCSIIQPMTSITRKDLRRAG